MSLKTKPENYEVLKSFYKQVRPWGFWGPVYEMVKAEDPDFARNKNFKRDMLNVAVGIAWQTSLITIPIYLVLKQYVPLAVSVSIVAVTSIFLKFNWFNKLEEN